MMTPDARERSSVAPAWMVDRSGLSIPAEATSLKLIRIPSRQDYGINIATTI
jgi:hypothetical protein